MGDRNNKDNELQVLVSFNECIGMIKMIELNYTPEAQEMAEMAILSALSKVYLVKTAYLRILSYMRENGLYEKYAKPILEMYLNPPIKQDSDEEGEEDREEEKQGRTPETRGDKNKSKPTKTKQMDREFWKKMFDDENFDNN